jgi:hypothetical protein
MLSNIAITALLAISGATASTMEARNANAGDKSVRVILENQAIELGSQTVFKNVNQRREKPPVGSSGPFQTLEVNLGKDVTNTALRCQALDASGLPIVGTRGTNIDTSFSDADKGAWTLRPAAGAEVATVVCDPALVAISAAEFGVTVILQNQATELGTQTSFNDTTVREVGPPVGSAGPYQTVEISVGSQGNQALRCKLLNGAGKPIVATRGENVDTTFSDADKGAWTFNRQAKVSKIICDPKFVADPQ